MKTRFIFWAMALAWTCGQVGAQTAPLASTSLQVKARGPVPELSCAAVPRRPSAAGAQDPDPLEVPDEEQVHQQMAAGSALAERPPAPANGAWAGLGGRRGQALKVAIWGDSHQAAGFFSGELVRLLQWPADAVAPWIVPANMNRPGVRLALRKTCTSEHWRYEPAYHVADAAAHPGPGLVSMSAALPGAQLAWDLRNANGVADKSRIRILYQQTVQAIRLGVTVDGGQEQVVELRSAAGAAALELLGDGPLSVVSVRLLEGQMRWQGLELPLAESTRLVMDVFGYPGATVAAWRRADADQLRAWWPDGGYDLVVLAFGTNEGNVRPFDSASYFQTLKASVSAWRQQFPQAACVLIGPGDRGVLVRRSENAKSKKPGQRPPAAPGAKKQGNQHSAKNSSAKHRSGPSGGRSVQAPAAPAAGKASAQDLLKYTRIHEEIGAMQEKLAFEHGCRYWSMLDAMGGSGGAYRWVRNSPPWMAKDLIHFTVPGYQRLAQLFAEDIGWQKSLGQGQP